ncbi:AMP-binding protein [Devosia sp. 66-22]|uniref:class I adenylate-forming enzyme family protein n=1 Tax=Devosia sp. 66-22 TaxID=1895753 RepID=UPI00092699F5|nr:AMP-binding protein [Devosia sp. 66-22]OJX53019.1 MAG: AMP-dependent synthetase [Devosia sp. 66-22]
MRVETFLTASAARFGDKTALVAGTTRLSYAELDAMSDRLAAGLKARGVGRDDRVLVFLDNCWEAAVAIFATLKAGATFSPINASTKADKLAYIAANCDARAIISQPRLAGIVTEATGLGASFPLVVLTDPHPGLPDAADFGALLETPVTLPLNTGIDVDLAMLIYTSGSTGRPKGVMMTHRNIEAAATSITTYLENTPDDIILNVLPLAFDYGLYQLLMSVKIGATLVLEKSFAFPQAIFATLRNEKVTGFPLVPTMAAMILNMKDLAPGSFPDLRYISNTAAALPPAHIARLRELLPGTTIFSMYGLTECKRCTYLPPARLDDKTGSVGVAIPNTEAFVVDDDGRRVAPGEVGQLVIRGPHVMQGYWANPEATAKALRPGPNPWEKVLYTGDLFYADADGFLYFVGRTDDIIKTRGEKVAPKEVEAVLSACPGVVESVVVGRSDPVLGQSIHAIVVASDPALTERDVIRHCARALEEFMVPKSVEFRDSLPKTDTGKVSRRLAAESLEPAI